MVIVFDVDCSGVGVLLDVVLEYVDCIYVLVWLNMVIVVGVVVNDNVLFWKLGCIVVDYLCVVGIDEFVDVFNVFIVCVDGVVVGCNWGVGLWCFGVIGGYVFSFGDVIIVLNIVDYEFVNCLVICSLK